MKKLNTSFILLSLLLALLLAGCSLDAPSDPTGQVNDPTPADASTPYVAIGNSLTAGYMDSGLMKAGQANSYPMIVATQMGLNKDTFTQPWIDAPGIGTTDVSAAAPGHVAGVLHFNGSAVLPLGLTPNDDISGLLLAVAQPTQYHNLGVPGAFSFDIMNAHSASTSHAAPPPFSTPNSFFEFINRAGADTPQLNLFGNVSIPPSDGAPGYESGSQFYQTIAKGPALVTAWVGGNDFLFGATSGDPLGPANVLITPAGDIANPVPGTFAYNYKVFLHSLAGGLLQRNGFAPTIITATLPLVQNITYFLKKGTFESVFGVRVYDEPDPQYILFTDFLGEGMPATLPANMTLSGTEVAYLDNEVIGAYNTIIQTVTAEVNGNPAVPAHAGFVDFNANLDDLQTTNPDAKLHFLFLRAKYAAEAEPIAVTAARTYFSLDGVHPNNKGYAFVANGFLAIINGVTGSNWIEVPVDAFTWDPTYGVPIPSKAAQIRFPQISPEVVAAMKRNF